MWVVVLFVCLGVFLVCFFVVCFLFFVFRFLHSKCDKGSGLCIGPLPVYFCGHYSFGPCTSQLINLICNMLGNMLNDLAEAIRRWTEKKNSPLEWSDRLTSREGPTEASRHPKHPIPEGQ